MFGDSEDGMFFRIPSFLLVLFNCFKNIIKTYFIRYSKMTDRNYYLERRVYYVQYPRGRGTPFMQNHIGLVCRHEKV